MTCKFIFLDLQIYPFQDPSPRFSFVIQTSLTNKWRHCEVNPYMVATPVRHLSHTKEKANQKSIWRRKACLLSFQIDQILTKYVHWSRCFVLRRVWTLRPLWHLSFLHISHAVRLLDGYDTLVFSTYLMQLGCLTVMTLELTPHISCSSVMLDD